MTVLCLYSKTLSRVCAEFYLTNNLMKTPTKKIKVVKFVRFINKMHLIPLLISISIYIDIGIGILAMFVFTWYKINTKFGDITHHYF